MMLRRKSASHRPNRHRGEWLISPLAHRPPQVHSEIRCQERYCARTHSAQHNVSDTLRIAARAGTSEREILSKSVDGVSGDLVQIRPHGPPIDDSKGITFLHHPGWPRGAD
jgi:hypothetical protein